MKTYAIAGLVAVLAAAGTLAPAPARHGSVAANGRDSAVVDFPGGYIAEIHD